MTEKDGLNSDQLPISQKKILLSMLKLKEASAYTLSKDTAMSYAIMYEGVAKLTTMGYLMISSRSVLPTDSTAESKSRRSKTTYALTKQGEETAVRITKLEKVKELNILSNQLKEEKSKEIIDYRNKLIKEIQKFDDGNLSNINKKEDLSYYQNSKKRMFVIMPASSIFDDVWKGAIEKVCIEQKYACLRIQQISSSLPILEELEKILDETQVVVADITGLNPNVMFEVGLALGKGKTVLMLKQVDNHSPLPFEFSRFRYLPYTNTWIGIEQLRENIKKRIVEIQEEKG